MKFANFRSSWVSRPGCPGITCMSTSPYRSDDRRHQSSLWLKSHPVPQHMLGTTFEYLATLLKFAIQPGVNCQCREISGQVSTRSPILRNKQHSAIHTHKAVSMHLSIQCISNGVTIVLTDIGWPKTFFKHIEAETKWPQSGWGQIRICICPACRTTLVATRFRVAVICPIIQVPHCIRVFFYFV